MPVLLIWLGLAALAGPSSVFAQPPGAAYGGYGWGGGWGGGTAAGNYQMGAADLTRAAGMYNLTTAMAAISAEQAQSMDIQNRLKATESYFEMRKMNQSYRAAESAARNHNTEGSFRYGHAAMVKRLTIAKLDPITGKLDWPKILLRDKYAKYRQTLDRLFAQRAAAPGGLSGDAYQEAVNTCMALQDLLKQDLPEYQPNDWVQAKNFIDSLAYECGSPAT
jgi:hypothetical protein